MIDPVDSHVLHLKGICSGLDLLAGMIDDKIVTKNRLTEDDSHGLLALLQSLSGRLDAEADRFEDEFSGMKLINTKEMGA